MSLIVKGVSKRFDATQALDQIDLEVKPGEVVALLGENGAGKSTLSNIIAGTFPPDTGNMQWQGRPYAPAEPGEAIAAGIGMIHQELRLLPDLSVAENVFIGRWPMKGGRVDRDQMNARAAAQLQRLGLDISPERNVRSLRVAAQQQVEIAKALTLDAKLLLLDEPTAALGAEETEHLFAVIDQLRTEGVSFIYVSHRLEEIARIADRIVVLRDGRWVASHDSAQVPVSQLIEDMVGRNLERLFPAADEPGSEEVLQVNGLTGNGFRDVSFAVRAGEILGIAGIVGAGRTELVRAIAGADAVTAGSVSVSGTPLRLGDPLTAIRAGIALVPEDRKTQGLVLMLSVADNLALGVANCGRVAGTLLRLRQVISRRRAGELATDYISRFKIRARGPEQLVLGLSGGNQQKVVLSKCLATKPVLMILDEPTRGVDVGSKAELYRVIAGLADDGVGVLMLSSEVQEVVETCDRIYVLRQGRVAAEVAGPQATEGSLMRHATAEAAS